VDATQTREPVVMPDAIQHIHQAHPETLLAWMEELSEPDRRAVIHVRLSRDLLWFGSQVWPDRFYLPFNRAHLWISTTVGALPSWEERVAAGQRETCVALEAPRGLAKTMFLKLLILRAIAYHSEPYVMWLGGSVDEAVKETRHIRSFLEAPSAEFVRLYGVPLVAGTDKDWIVTIDGYPVKVSTRGIPRGRVRGANYNGQRPTLIVGDDIEHPDSVRNPRLRDGLTRYINSDVRNAGPKEGGLLWVQFGTRLSQDSQTARASKDPAYLSARFQSVLRWPDRSELWERCRGLWCDLTDPDRQETARRFYEHHRAEMDEGAEVLDEVAQPIYTLYTLLWSKGWYSFLADYQNDPSDPTRQLFYPERWRRCSWDGGTITTSSGRQVLLSECKLGVWLDPRASEQVERNDYAALAIVARDSHGYVYVLSIDIRREGTLAQLERLWAVFDLLGPSALYGYEQNGFQILMGREFKRLQRERQRAHRPSNCILRGFTSTRNKADRIASLAPRIDNGWIEFATSISQTVIEQWRDHPASTHDDGPDATERAIWLVEGGGAAEATLGRP
jgi:predicted phage terminase large subunit-like protein